MFQKIINTTILFFLIFLAQDVFAHETYDHDHWGTSSNCIIEDFKAYRSCFDNLDDNDDDGIPDAWGVPKWVAYEMKYFDGSCINTEKDRPAWKSDKKLSMQGIMPDDKSYAYSKNFKADKNDWFSRGHLAMKMHTERLGKEAGVESFSFFNAVPQRQLFNAGIWQDLEDITSIWAQEYGTIWIIAGPIFADKYPVSYLGEEGELPVAIPDALFKIIIKNSLDPKNPDVIAFIYPQVGPGYYAKGGFNHERYLTTVNEIETLTGLDFLMILPNEIEEQIESKEVKSLWGYKKKNFVKACAKPKYNE